MRHRLAQPVEDGRHQIHRLGEAIDDTAADAAGVADDQRQEIGLVEPADLAQQAMVAKLFAVV